MKLVCEYCNGKGENEVKVGDVVTPTDGSGLPNGLHPILWNGMGSSPAFSPVKVLHIEGNAMFVVPKQYPCQWDAAAFNARSWMMIDGKGTDGFWIYAPHCHLRRALAKAEGGSDDS